VNRACKIILRTLYCLFVFVRMSVRVYISVSVCVYVRWCNVYMRVHLSLCWEPSALCMFAIYYALIAISMGYETHHSCFRILRAKSSYWVPNTSTRSQLSMRFLVATSTVPLRTLRHEAIHLFRVHKRHVRSEGTSQWHKSTCDTLMLLNSTKNSPVAAG